MGELANCPGCGKLFVKETKHLCKACYEKDEAEFQTVYRFFSRGENVRATLTEVSEGTGISEETIIRFIKEGRLRLIEFPNLAYPCESCGTMIRKKKLCESCIAKLQGVLERFENDQDRNRQQEKHMRTRRYYSDEPPSKR